jgi:replication initiation protein RepC
MDLENSVEEAPRRGSAYSPTGFRRLTPGLLQVDRTAENFAGLPDGVTAHGQLLAAFKAAAPRLGLSTRLVHTVDWLFKFTQPQDWERGGRPIVWPSALLQQEALGLSETQAKRLNRCLIEAGLVTMKDSPNGKRYAKRDPKGRIVEAYGFECRPRCTLRRIRAAGEEGEGGARGHGGVYHAAGRLRAKASSRS